MMKCVLLAAGAATRLRPLTTSTPKCLLSVGGTAILTRIFHHLRSVGITDLCIVTGFRAGAIRSHVRTHAKGFSVTFIHNNDFATTNNAVSLALTRFFVGNDPFLLMDGDIVFGKGLLKFLLGQKRKPNRLAVRVRGDHDEEEIRVAINRWDHITGIGKTIPLNRTYGESVGIAVFSPPASTLLFHTLEKRTRTRTGRKEFYETSFQSLIDDGNRMWAVDIGDFPCAEIDTAEDLAYANDFIASLLEHV